MQISRSITYPIYTQLIFRFIFSIFFLSILLPLKNGWLHGPACQVSEGAQGLGYGRGRESDGENPAQAIHKL